MNKLTASDYQEIKRLYLLGMSPLEIGKKFGIFNNSVTRILKKMGVPRNQAAQQVGTQTINIIIDRYKNGESSEVIAKDLKINGTTVCRILKRNKIAIRPGIENKRRYKINTRIFQFIDTPEKAYWLGFLYADGHLKTDATLIKLLLKEDDKEVLEKFSKFIYGFIKIESEQKALRSDPNIVKTYLRVCVTSKEMHSDLTNVGCMPQKTFKIRMPLKHVKKELMPHFIRGFLDGDGCICLSSESRPVVDFTSNKMFCEDLKDYLEAELNIKFNKIHLSGAHQMTARLQLTGFNAIKRLLDYIYKDVSDLCMKRKQEKYLEFLNLYDNCSKHLIRHIPELSIDEFIDIESEFNYEEDLIDI